MQRQKAQIDKPNVCHLTWKIISSSLKRGANEINLYTFFAVGADVLLVKGEHKIDLIMRGYAKM